MRVIALISTFAATAMAFKFHGKVPFASNGTPLSHQLPKQNAELTQAAPPKLAKRRLVEEYIPTSEEIENLKRDFDDVIPGMFQSCFLSSVAYLFLLAHVKRDSSVK
jgi:hypothetical protein